MKMASKEFKLEINNLDNFPRSIRWRILFGLIQNDTSNPSDNLFNRNCELLHKQRQTYDDLVKKYFHSSSALAIIGDTEKFPSSPLKKSAQSAATQVKVVCDDPLSLMAKMEETRVKVEKEKDLARKKEQISASRSTIHHPLKHESSSSNIDQSVTAVENRWNDFYTSRETMDIIQKDLDRLPVSHHVYFHQIRTGEVLSYSDSDLLCEDGLQSRKIRSKALSEILFVYARKNFMGYRQGMHEVLSFILMAIEQDLISEKNSNQESEYNGLLSDKFKIHDSYNLFQSIMDNLQKTFESRLERHGLNIVAIIKEWYGDEELATFIETLDVPPQVYCSRWTRLMFSREVKENLVFQLWDEIFFQSAVDNSDHSFLRVLETASASMIILIQSQLLGENDVNEAMHLLMNYPKMDEVGRLIELMRTLLSNQRSGFKPAKIQRTYPVHLQAVYSNHDVEPTVKTSNLPIKFYTADNPHMLHQSSDLNESFDQTNHSGPPYDQARRTLEQIKHGQAWAKVSNSLKDAWHSIDTKLQTMNISTDFKIQSHLDTANHDTVDEQNDHQEGHFEYRDLSSFTPLFEPTKIIEQNSNLSSVKNSGVEEEDDFVGGNNLVGSEKEEASLLLRMDHSLSDLRSFINLSGDKVPGYVLDAVTNLESLRDELKSKYVDKL
jgi:TBC1 domain family protein 5